MSADSTMGEAIASLKTSQKSQDKNIDWLLENQNNLTNFQGAILGTITFALGSSVTIIGFLLVA